VTTSSQWINSAVCHNVLGDMVTRGKLGASEEIAEFLEWTLYRRAMLFKRARFRPIFVFCAM
jgi:hypothetical protein